MVDMDLEEYRKTMGLPVKQPAIKPGKGKAAKRKPLKEPSSLEKKFLLCISGLPKPEREYRFHPVRRWRWDFAWPAQKLAVEVDGGAFATGGHSRAIPQAGDNDKTNSAINLGWRVLKFNTFNLKHPQAVRDVVCEALGITLKGPQE